MRKQINPMPFGPHPLKSPLASKFYRENVAEKLSYLTTSEHLTWEQVLESAAMAEAEAIRAGLQNGDLTGLEVRIRGKGPGNGYSHQGRNNGVVWLVWKDGEPHLADAFCDLILKGKDITLGFFPKGASAAVVIDCPEPPKARKESDGDQYWWKHWN